jgi:TonB family protein
VSLARNSLFPYLVVSAVFHLVLAFAWGNRPVRPPPMEEILVKLLPPPAAQERPAPRAAAPAPRESAPATPPQSSKQLARQTPRDRPHPAELPPGQHAKIDRPGAEMPPRSKPAPSSTTETKPAAEPAQTSVETAKNDKALLAGPTLKDLLPPVYQPSSAEKSGDERTPIRLDSRDPRYTEYLSRVKQALQLAWSDPTVARSAIKPFGLEGKLVVQFTPDENGGVEEILLTRTSGYAFMDQEALRVIAAAAPHFGRPPRSFGKRPIDVTFIYEKDSVSYSFVPR